jgi:hypothetical protein
MTSEFQALGSRRFQRGFDRVNLHRPTEGDAAVPVPPEEEADPDPDA